MANKIWRVEIVGGEQDGLVMGIDTNSNDEIIEVRNYGRNIHEIFPAPKFAVSDVTGYDLIVALKNVRGYASPMDSDDSIVMHDAY